MITLSPTKPVPTDEQQVKPQMDNRRDGDVAVKDKHAKQRPDGNTHEEEKPTGRNKKYVNKMQKTQDSDKPPHASHGR